MLSRKSRPGWGEFVISTVLNVGLWFWLVAWYEIVTEPRAAWPVAGLIALLWPYRLDLPSGRIVYTVPMVGRWLDGTGG